MKRRLVMIVDDDRAIRESLAAVMADADVDVTPARDGREALTVLRAGPRPDLILLDLMMPIMNGMEFRAAQVRDPDLATIPTVLITAGNPGGPPPEGLQILLKPFRAEDVLALLDRAGQPS